MHLSKRPLHVHPLLTVVIINFVASDVYDEKVDVEAMGDSIGHMTKEDSNGGHKHLWKNDNHCYVGPVLSIPFC